MKAWLTFSSAVLDDMRERLKKAPCDVPYDILVGLFPPEALREDDATYLFRDACMSEGLPNLHEMNEAMFDDWLRRCDLWYTIEEDGSYRVRMKGEMTDGDST